MPWQFGGNFEPVKVICETDWKECPKAIVNYLWSEIVTDVVDYMMTDGMIWRVLLAVLLCFLLVHTFYCKARWLDETTVNNQGLNKIGHQVQDLELKVNVLTYKIQYGKWPLPHQLQFSFPEKKLHNVRLTVSDSNERHAWIKHILLSPTERYGYHRLSKLDRNSIQRLTDLFNMEPKCTVSDFQRYTLPTTYSSDRILKYDNEKYSVKRKKQEGNMHLKDNYHHLSKNDSFQVRDVKQKPNIVLRNKECSMENLLTSSASGGETLQYGTLTKTLDECKHFLRKLEDSNKKSPVFDVTEETKISLKNGSPSRNEIEPRIVDTKSVNNDEDNSIFYTMKKAQGNKFNAQKHQQLNQNRKQIKQKFVSPKLDITFQPEKLHRNSSLQNLSYIFTPLRKQQKIVHKSQEILYQIKQRLESLHNVLKVYEIQDLRKEIMEDDTKPAISENVVETLNCIKEDIENMNQNIKSDILYDKNKRNLLINHTRKRTSFESDQTSSTSVHSYSSILAIQEKLNELPTKYSNYTSIQDIMRIYKKNKRNYKSLPEFSKNQIRRKTWDCCAKLIKPVELCASHNLEKKYMPIENNINEITSTELSHSEQNEENEFLNFRKKSFSVDNNLLLHLSSDNSEKYPMPMETDEDIILTSEITTESESDDKSTNKLLRQALQYKNTILNEVQSFFSKRLQENLKSDVFYENDCLKSTLTNCSTNKKPIRNMAKKTNKTYLHMEMKKSSNQDASYKSANDEIKEDNKKMNIPSCESNTIKNIMQNNINDLLTADNKNNSNQRYCTRLETSIGNDMTESERKDKQYDQPKIENKNKFMQQSIDFQECTELFSQNQKEAFIETRKDIQLQNKNENVEFSVVENITLNKNIDSSSSENFMQLPNIEEDEDTGDDKRFDYQFDKPPLSMTLKRRPGMFSLKDTSLSNADLSKETESKIPNEINVLHDGLITNQISSEQLYRYESINALNITSVSTSQDKKFTSIMPSSSKDNTPYLDNYNIKNKSHDNVSKIDENNQIQTPEDKNIIFSKDNIKISDNDMIVNQDKKLEVEEIKIENIQSNNIEEDNAAMPISSENLTLRNINSNIKSFEQNSESTTKMTLNLTMKTEILTEKKSEEFSNNYYTHEVSKDEVKNKNTDAESCKAMIYEEVNTPQVLEEEKCNCAPIQNTKENHSLNSNLNLSNNTSTSYVDASSQSFISTSYVDLDKTLIDMSASEATVTTNINKISSIVLQRKNTYIQDSKGNAQLENNLNKQNSHDKLDSKFEKSKSLPTTKVESKQSNRKFSARNRDLSVESNSHSSENNNYNLTRRRSRSSVTPRKCESSPRHCPNKSVNDESRCSTPENKLKTLSLPIPKTFAKSSIPVLKNRLEAANRWIERNSRSRSPVRGPLTIATPPNKIDSSTNTTTTLETVIQAEGETLVSKTKRTEQVEAKILKTCETREMNIPAIKSQDRIVVYVNIVTNNDQNVTRIVDPEKFLEYVNGKHLDVRNIQDNNKETKENLKRSNSSFRESQYNSGDLAVASSSVNNNQQSNNSQQLIMNIDNISMAQSLPSDSIKNLYTVDFGQREVDVTAKPSVRETSTSISDLRDISILLRNVQTNQIWDVPKELTEDECTVLFDTLNQKSNFMHLQKLRNVCDKLKVKFP